MPEIRKLDGERRVGAWVVLMPAGWMAPAGTLGPDTGCE